MTVKKHDLLKIEIEKMAFGGKGIGRVDGFVVFVKGGVPGDRVAATVIKKKKDFAEAVLEEVLTPSQDRTEAPCPYFGYCGGCQWQHVRYERQLAFKRAHVEESLRHIGGLDHVLVHDTIPSENRFGYRNKMEFSFSDRRWLLPEEMGKAGVEDDFALGLHVPGNFSKVIDMDMCLLQREAGNGILREVKRLARESGLGVYGLKSHKGFWRFVTIRYSTAFDQWMVNLVTSGEQPEILLRLARTLMDSNGQVISVMNNITGKKAAVAVGEREVVLAGQEHIFDRIGPYRFQISANSFFQTNSLGAQKLYQTVVDFGGFQGNETVLDLYSGTGTIPIFLSSRVRNVVGLEIVESAVQDARKNCDRNEVRNCRFVCGDIRTTMPSLDFTPDVLVIDPPRAGMHKDVLKGIMELSPERIVYVSCNPTTMARDLSQMTENYEVVEIQPIDMFPQTYHIESVAKLRHRKKGG